MKRKWIQKIIFALLPFSLVVLGGCGSDDDDGGGGSNVMEEVKNTAREAKLMRAWESDCKRSGLLNAFVREYYQFKGNDFQKAQEFYVKEGCEEPVARLQYSGAFQLKDEVENIKDARQINMQFKKVFVTPLTVEGKELMESTNFCGITEWETGKEVELTDRSMEGTCPVENVPKEHFNIVKVDDHYLHWGKVESQADGAHEGDRPSEINQTQVFRHSQRNFI